MNFHESPLPTSLKHMDTNEGVIGDGVCSNFNCEHVKQTCCNQSVCESCHTDRDSGIPIDLTIFETEVHTASFGRGGVQIPTSSHEYEIELGSKVPVQVRLQSTGRSSAYLQLEKGLGEEVELEVLVLDGGGAIADRCCEEVVVDEGAARCGLD